MKFKLLVSILLFTLFLCCSKTTDPIVETINDHFDYVVYDGLTSANILGISQELERNYARILSDLQVDSMPKISVKIWGDYDHFLEDMENDIGIRYTGATGYVFGMTEIRIFYNSQAPVTAVHEFAHSVSMQVNSRIPNNPRWLWEAVALYETNEFVDPRTLPYMVSGNYPTLEELNSDYNSGNRSIYSVGYILLEYIIVTWEMDQVIELIQTNGNIPLALRITVEEFESGWYQFLEEKYLI